MSHAWASEDWLVFFFLLFFARRSVSTTTFHVAVARMARTSAGECSWLRRVSARKAAIPHRTMAGQMSE